jgi:hypothetical protein
LRAREGVGSISGDIQFRFFLIACAIFFLSLLAAPSLDSKELARDKPDFIRCAADLKEALNSNNLGERISFGYINCEGGIPHLADYNGEQLLVKGNGEVTFKNIAELLRQHRGKE